MLEGLDRMAAEPPERASGRLLLPRAIELGETLAAGLIERRRSGHARAARRLGAAYGRQREGHRPDRRHDASRRRSRRASRGWERSSTCPPPVSPARRGRTHSGVSVDLRIAKPAQLGNLLQHFTGSGPHNAALREAAVRRGLHVSEYGVLEDASGVTHICATEQEVYELLGLSYIEPELRENRGELDGARRRRAAPADRAGGHSRRSAQPHDGLRREELNRGDGARRARARVRVPSDHRSLGLTRLRRRCLARAAAPPDRAGARGKRARWMGSSCSRAARSTSCPTARSTTRTSCSPSSTG